MKPRQPQGITKLEFLLAVAVITVLALVALERLQEVQEVSEKTVVDSTLRNISSGLRYAMSEHIIHGEEFRIAELIGSNPVRWLAQPPEGYHGEFAAAPERLPDGAWFFDTTRRELCYRPKLDRHLEIEGGAHQLCWRIESASASPGAVAAVRVVAVHGYRWF